MASVVTLDQVHSDDKRVYHNLYYSSEECRRDHVIYMLESVVGTFSLFIVAISQKNFLPYFQSEYESPVELMEKELERDEWRTVIADLAHMKLVTKKVPIIIEMHHKPKKRCRMFAFRQWMRSYAANLSLWSTRHSYTAVWGILGIVTCK